MQRYMHVILQKALILCIASLMYGCTGFQETQNFTCCCTSSADQRSAAETELRESHYPNGYTLKEKMWVSSEGQIAAYEWYLPSGEVLWRANWLCEDCGHSHESGFFLDEQGRIKQVVQFCDEGTRGYGLTFDPPVAPSRIQKFVDGEMVEEHDVSVREEKTGNTYED